MKKSLLFSFATVSVVFTVFFTLGFAYPSGSPGGKSGSPGDGGATCTQCHAGTAQEAADWISSTVPVDGFEAGNTYTITATGTHSGVSLFGFELTAEDNSGSKTGTFSITNATETKLTNSNAAVTHTSGGTSPDGDSKSWEFDWTAPADVDEVTFYAAINAANGNGSTSGDVIYTSALTIMKAAGTNSAPVFTSTPVTEATADAEYVYNVETSDNDGDALSISAATLPAWLSFTDNGDGTAIISGTPSTADEGNHEVSLQVSDGIADAVEQSFIITVEVSTRVAELNTFSFDVYPNPSSGNITVEFLTDAKNGYLEIYDYAGKKVREVYLNNIIATIDLNVLDKGVYFLRIKENKHTRLKKIVLL